MCQLARQYNEVVIHQFADTEKGREVLTVDNILTVVDNLNAIEFRQEPPA